MWRQRLCRRRSWLSGVPTNRGKLSPHSGPLSTTGLRLRKADSEPKHRIPKFSTDHRKSCMAERRARMFSTSRKRMGMNECSTRPDPDQATSRPSPRLHPTSHALDGENLIFSKQIYILVRPRPKSKIPSESSFRRVTTTACNR
jgi:hypothetical protein